MPEQDNKYYDAFISYRRNNGAEIAQLIQNRLNAIHIIAYRDIRNLGPGQFDEQLRKAIENSPNFLIVLTAGALDKCLNEDDALLMEVKHAIHHKKNIIPVIKEDFEFPNENTSPRKDELPEEIINMLGNNGTQYSDAHLDSTINDLIVKLKDIGQYSLKKIIDKYKSEKIFRIPITLEQLYVEPKAEVFLNGQSIEKGNVEELIKKYLQNDKLLIIESPYGMGKTSLLKKLAYDTAEDWKKDMENNPFPILVNLGEYRSYHSSDLRSFIKERNSLEINDSGRYLFLFDAFDELCFSPEDAKKFINGNMKDDLYKNFTKSKFIISTRPNTMINLTTWNDLASFPRIKIEEFNSELQNKWIDKWNSHTQMGYYSFPKDDINISKVKALLGTPLFLFIAAVTIEEWLNAKPIGCFGHTGGNILPSNNLTRSKLYDLFLKATVEGKLKIDEDRKDENNFIHGLPIIDKGYITKVQYVELLAKIAYLIFTNNKGYVTLNELVEELKEINDAVRDLGRECIKSIFLCYAFEAGAEEHSYKFAHQSMMEYLVAKYYKENPDKEDELLKHLTHDTWREIFVFYVEMISEGHSNRLLLEVHEMANNYIKDEPKIIDLLKWANKKAINATKDTFLQKVGVIYYYFLAYSTSATSITFS